MKIRIRAFDLGYRIGLALEIGGHRRAWMSPKLPLPLHWASLKYLWRHRHAH
jgi:hypothetical protein